MMGIYHFLILLGICCLIVEIFIPSFIAGSLAIGFFVAAFGSWIDVAIKWQILLFSVGVLGSFFSIRPLLITYGYKAVEKIKTNQQALLHARCKVVEEINNDKNRGRVSIDGDVWRAKSYDNTIYPIDSHVEIIEINSIILIVKSLN